MKVTWKSCIKIGLSAIFFWLIIHYWDIVVHGVGVVISAGAPLVLGALCAYVANILMRFYENHIFNRDNLRKEKASNNNSVLRRLFPFINKSKSDKPAKEEKQRKKKADGKTAAFFKKVSRPVSLFLAVLTVVILISVIVRMIVPELIVSGKMLMEKLPDYLDKAYVFLEEKIHLSALLGRDEPLLPDERNWKDILTSILAPFLSDFDLIAGPVASAVTGVISKAISFFMSMIFGMYILLSKEKLGKQIHRIIRSFCGEKIEYKFFFYANIVDESFHNCLVGQVTEALILGTLCTIGMLIFKFPYAVMVGTLVGVMQLVPIVGAWISAIVGTFLVFTVSPIKSVYFLIFLLVLQYLEGNIVYPRVVGQSVGLPAIWTLAAISLGGGLGGIIGMLIAIPIAATAYRLVKTSVEMRESNHSQPLFNLRRLADSGDNDKDNKD